jgi:hypothetical protein
MAKIKRIPFYGKDRIVYVSEKAVKGLMKQVGLLTKLESKVEGNTVVFTYEGDRAKGVMTLEGSLNP